MIALNPDLIERVEANPDTVVTMIDETKFLIDEPVEEVLRLIIDYRAYIIARSRDIEVTSYDPSGRPLLQLVPDELVSNINHDDGLSDDQAEALGALRAVDAFGDGADHDPDDGPNNSDGRLR